MEKVGLYTIISLVVAVGVAGINALVMLAYNFVGPVFGLPRLSFWQVFAAMFVLGMISMRVRGGK